MTRLHATTAPSEYSASALAAALAARAEQVCRRYLPRGRKQRRYWTVGDVHGTEGRSLYVRLVERAGGLGVAFLASSEGLYPELRQRRRTTFIQCGGDSASRSFCAANPP